MLVLTRCALVSVAPLIAERLQAQKDLILAGIERSDPIFVSPSGAVADGHHGVRAAIDLGASVAVIVLHFEIEPGEFVLELPIE